MRFAPSPTGPLHLGNARTALYNWLFTRRCGGRFIIRIEDTDPERSLPDFETRHLDALRWLGLEWDEGPDKGGEYGPYRQAERRALHLAAAEALEREGKAFRCWCTQAELAADRARALAEGRPPRYSGRCRELTGAQVATFRAEGRRSVLRFRSETGRIRVDDLIHGPTDFPAAECDDFVLVRSSGLPTYNLACAVDDDLMGISHVIRGADHLPNAPRQVALMAALDRRPPLYAHFGLVVDDQGLKLSKRSGGLTVDQVRTSGLPPGAVTHHLARLGGGLGLEDGGPLEVVDLIRRFDLTRVSPGPVNRDPEGLESLAARHLRSTPIDRLADDLLAWWPTGQEMLSAPAARPFLERAVALAVDNSATYRDLAAWVLILALGHPEIDPEGALLVDMEAGADLRAWGETGRRALSAGLAAPWSADWAERVEEIAGLDGKRLYTPLRLALTGRRHGPPFSGLIDLLTAGQVRQRLEYALELNRET